MSAPDPRTVIPDVWIDVRITSFVNRRLFYQAVDNLARAFRPLQEQLEHVRWKRRNRRFMLRDFGSV